jgi:hypothetical protein
MTQDIRDEIRDGEQAYVSGEPSEPVPGTAWPDLDRTIITHQRMAAPRLPIELFGKKAHAWVVNSAESKGAPPDFVALPLLACIGAILANHRRAQPWAGWTMPPIINVAIVGNPSSTKSPAIDAVDQPLRELQDELNVDFVQDRNQYYADLVLQKDALQTWENEVKEAAKRGLPPPEMPEKAVEPKKPSLKRLILNDAATEKVIRLSAENVRGLVWKRDELAGLFGGLDRYGGSGSDWAFLLECFEGRSYIVDRVKDEGNPIMTPALSIAIVGGIQPDRLNSMLLAGDDDGLAARFLFTWPERIPPVRPKRTANNEDLKDAFRRLLDLDREPDGKPTLVTFDENAADALMALREKIWTMEEGVSGLLLSWLGKVPGYAVRLALIFEMLWWAFDRSLDLPPVQISRRAFDAAETFMMGYALPMARRTFGDTALPQVERESVTIAKWLLSQPDRPVGLNARALRQAGILSHKIADRYDAALAELVEAGWLRPALTRAGPTKGRAAKNYLVNPRVWEATP